MRARVIEAYERTCADPITFRAGDLIHLTGRTYNWEGYTWVWAVGPDGREGWIPPSTVNVHAGEWIAVRDYSATELTVQVGEVVGILNEELGWCWCVNGDGIEGWVPKSKLERKT